MSIQAEGPMTCYVDRAQAVGGRQQCGPRAVACASVGSVQLTYQQRLQVLSYSVAVFAVGIRHRS